MTSPRPERRGFHGANPVSTPTLRIRSPGPATRGTQIHLVASDGTETELGHVRSIQIGRMDRDTLNTAMLEMSCVDLEVGSDDWTAYRAGEDVASAALRLADGYRQREPNDAHTAIIAGAVREAVHRARREIAGTAGLRGPTSAEAATALREIRTDLDAGDDSAVMAGLDALLGWIEDGAP